MVAVAVNDESCAYFEASFECLHFTAMDHGRLLTHHPILQQLLSEMVLIILDRQTKYSMERFNGKSKKYRKAEKVSVGWPGTQASASIRVGGYHGEHRTQLNT